MTIITIGGKDYQLGLIKNTPDWILICNLCKEHFFEQELEWNTDLKHHCFTKLEYKRFENQLNKLIDKFQFKGGWSADWQLKKLPFKVRINRLRIEANSKKQLLRKIETKIRHNQKRNVVTRQQLADKGDFMGYINHIMNEITNK